MTSIKAKLLPAVIICIILLGSVFYLFAVNTQEANVSQVTLDGITKSKNTFVNLEQDDVKMMKIVFNIWKGFDPRDIVLDDIRKGAKQNVTFESHPLSSYIG